MLLVTLGEFMYNTSGQVQETTVPSLLVIHRHFKRSKSGGTLNRCTVRLDESRSDELKKRTDGTSRTTIAPTVASIFLQICFRIQFVVKFQIINSSFSAFSFNLIQCDIRSGDGVGPSSAVTH